MRTVSPTRWNGGFFQPLERPALAWLAANLPQGVTPDHLTGIGFAGAVLVFIGYAASGSQPAFLWIASLGLAINWFGDSLDGTVARLRKIERPRYGYYLDNSIDCIAQLLAAFGIGLSGYVRFDLCLLALVAYLMVSALSFLRANVSGVFQISYATVGPTEVRVGFLVLNALLIILPPDSVDWGLPLSYPNLWSLAWSSAMLVAFLVCMVKQVRQLATEEPVREPAPRRAPGPEAEAGWLGLPPVALCASSRPGRGTASAAGSRAASRIVQDLGQRHGNATSWENSERAGWK
jgi:archaetidylinositol phosphate synthase